MLTHELDLCILQVVAEAKSLPHLVVAAETRKVLGASPEEAAKTLLALNTLDGLTGVTLRACRRAVFLLKTKFGEDISAPFQVASAAAFPLATWDDGSFVEY